MPLTPAIGIILTTDQTLNRNLTFTGDGQVVIHDLDQRWKLPEVARNPPPTENLLIGYVPDFNPWARQAIREYIPKHQGASTEAGGAGECRVYAVENVLANWLDKGMMATEAEDVEFIAHYEEDQAAERKAQIQDIIRERDHDDEGDEDDDDGGDDPDLSDDTDVEVEPPDVDDIEAEIADFLDDEDDGGNEDSEPRRGRRWSR